MPVRGRVLIISRSEIRPSLCGCAAVLPRRHRWPDSPFLNVIFTIAACAIAGVPAGCSTEGQGEFGSLRGGQKCLRTQYGLCAILMFSAEYFWPQCCCREGRPSRRVRRQPLVNSCALPLTMQVVCAVILRSTCRIRIFMPEQPFR